MSEKISLDSSAERYIYMRYLSVFLVYNLKIFIYE